MRIAFWSKTVAMSLLWGSATTRTAKRPHKVLQKPQRDHVVKMMALKRGVDEFGNYEPWLEYHIRRYRAAKIAINSNGANIVQMLKVKKLSCVGHAVRMGFEDKPQHLAKRVLIRRCLIWWRDQQQFNQELEEAHQVKHKGQLGRPRRFET